MSLVWAVWRPNATNPAVYSVAGWQKTRPAITWPVLPRSGGGAPDLQVCRSN